MKLIYHITTAQEWAAAQTAGQYLALSLDIEGFIHCSRQGQLLEVANLFFSGASTLLVLGISEEAVLPWLKDEGPQSNGDPFYGELFPHIYGPIPISAVVVLAELMKNEDGIFTWPADLPHS